LLRPGWLSSLGPGRPNEEGREQLRGLTTERLFAPQRIRDEDMAAACLAGLWLLHDCLDESHTLSQELYTAEGSYWHAILHRREPDPWNSKYWFRRVGDHPIYPELCAEAVKLAADTSCPSLLAERKWDAAAFVDLCAKHADPDTAAHDFCRRVQRAEWDLLFEHCYRRAVGR
jgi:hypothetical protein